MMGGYMGGVPRPSACLAVLCCAVWWEGIYYIIHIDDLDFDLTTGKRRKSKLMPLLSSPVYSVTPYTDTHPTTSTAVSTRAHRWYGMLLSRC